MNTDRPLFIPVILGTARQGRASEHVARFVLQEVASREGVETEFIDIREISITTKDAGEAIKDSKFSATVARSFPQRLRALMRSSSSCPNTIMVIRECSSMCWIQT